MNKAYFRFIMEYLVKNSSLYNINIVTMMRMTTISEKTGITNSAWKFDRKDRCEKRQKNFDRKDRSGTFLSTEQEYFHSFPAFYFNGKE